MCEKLEQQLAAERDKLFEIQELIDANKGDERTFIVVQELIDAACAVLNAAVLAERERPTKMSKQPQKNLGKIIEDAAYACSETNQQERKRVIGNAIEAALAKERTNLSRTMNAEWTPLRLNQLGIMGTKIGLEKACAVLNAALAAERQKVKALALSRENERATA